MYDTVLVPTAGGSGTARAVEYAVEEARSHGADIQLLSVKDPNSPLNAGPAGGFSSAEWEAEATAQADSAIESARDQIPDRIDVEAFVTSGIPKEAIVDHVEDHGVDLVVMATHGRTGVSRVLIGSTTESVVRHSPVPVLTVRTDEE